MAVCNCGRLAPYATNQAHCVTCHQQFSGPSAFDLHRTGSHADDTRRCLEPAGITDKNGRPQLVETDSKYGPIWRYNREGDHPFAADGSENPGLE